MAVQSSPSLFFFNSYELRPTVCQALWGFPSTRMNATVLFLLACLPGLFPHYRSLYFFVLGSITKEAECHLLASQQASGPFQDASLVCTKLTTLFNRLIQSWEEKGVSQELVSAPG